MEVIVGLIVAFAVGFGCSAIIFTRVVKRKPIEVGDLRIDRSDPDGPYLFLELKKGVEAFKHDDYVILKVNESNYITQD